MNIRSIQSRFVFCAIMLSFGMHAGTAFAQTHSDENSAEAASTPEDVDTQQEEAGQDAEAEPTQSADQPKTRNRSQAIDIKVNWYKPGFGGERIDDKQEVVFSGRTLPHARVTLKGAAIPMFEKGSKRPKAFRLRKKWVRNIPTRANENGLFRFSVFLPEGQFQLPVVVIHPDKRSNFRVYQVSFSVEKNEVFLPVGHRELEESPFLVKKNRLSLGVGANYLKFQETVQDAFDLSFQSFKGPAFFAEYWRLITPEFHFLTSAKVSPGATSSGGDVEVAQGEYNWITFTADAIYLPWSKKYGERSSRLLKWGGRVGLQYHLVPFIPPKDEDLQSNVVNVETNDIIMATLGFHSELFQGSRWMYEMYLRYQVPVIAGSLFEMQPKFAFDGSVGARYTFTSKKYALGVFWYGHWLSFDFKSEDKSGTHDLFFSNLEVRLSLQF